MDKLKMHSPDFTAQNIAKLAQLFPNCVTEAEGDDGQLQKTIDFDQLRQELSDSMVEGPRERYQLAWPGKKESLLAANAPIAKTLRPCRHESVDFDATKNLFIEGDNLDALKLLQETYLRKVKMIYIDPPFNTGNDFIYNDDFKESSAEYLLRSSQEDDDGNRLVANKEAAGRFHSDWLSMMYSRLRLARNMLADDGVIFISMDDHEADNLQKLCSEVFGEASFLGTLIWKRRQTVDSRAKTGISTDHEYVIVYGGTESRLRGQQIDLTKFKNPDNDPRGPWWSADLTGLATKDQRPNLHYDLEDPKTGLVYACPENGWRYSRDTMAQLIKEEKILWPSKAEGRPRLKRFRQDRQDDYTNLCSVLDTVFTTQGTRTLKELFDGQDVLDFPKPVEFVRLLVDQGCQNGGIVLDFFAGSGTTAQAVLEANASDGGNRQFILVQIPEPSGRTDFATIADISKERVRRAGRKISEDNATTAPSLDIGFRVLKVDSSNMKDVYYAPDGIKQGDLLDQIENIKEDRSPEDLLFQVLLDWGVDLSLPIAEETIEGKTVFFVDQNALAACFDKDINEELVKTLAARKPLRAVFRDSGYGNDSVKINVEQIFTLISPSTEVKSI